MKMLSPYRNNEIHVKPLSDGWWIVHVVEYDDKGLDYIQSKAHETKEQAMRMAADMAEWFGIPYKEVP